MEPPGPDVPAPAGSLAALGPLRLSAAAAAAALALSSTGDLVVLAALLAVAVARPLPTAAVVLALTAVLGRWGDPSLAALAGAQSVLGPAGWVGTAHVAASTWLASAALVLAVPSVADRRRPRGGELLVVLALGAVAAIVVAGPSGADRLGARLAAMAAAVGASVTVSLLPLPRLRAAVAVAGGVAAVGLAAG